MANIKRKINSNPHEPAIALAATATRRQLQILLKNQKLVTLVGPLYRGRKLPADQIMIYVDGGVRHRSRQGGSPSLSIGDGDSAPVPVDILLPARKNLSDLEFVLLCLPRHVRRISLLGFGGGRLDHQLCNLGALHRWLAGQNGLSEVSLDHQALGWNRGDKSIQFVGTFSLVAFAETQVRLKGACEYILNQWTTLPVVSSLGLSNCGHGEFTVSAKGPVFWLPSFDQL